MGGWKSLLAAVCSAAAVGAGMGFAWRPEPHTLRPDPVELKGETDLEHRRALVEAVQDGIKAAGEKGAEPGLEHPDDSASGVTIRSAMG